MAFIVQWEGLVSHFASCRYSLLVIAYEFYVVNDGIVLSEMKVRCIALSVDKNKDERS